MSERRVLDSSQLLRDTLMEEAPNAGWTYADSATDYFLEDWDDIRTAAIGTEVDTAQEGNTEEMLKRLERLEAGRNAGYEVGVEGDFTYVRAHLDETSNEHWWAVHDADGIYEDEVHPPGERVVFEARTRDVYPEKLIEG